MTPGGMAGLSAVILLLGGTIVDELTGRHALPAGLSTSHSHLPDATGRNTREAASQGDIDARIGEVLARPVFNLDRRPVGIGTHTVAGLTRLTGIIVTGSRKVAIFAGQAGGRPVVAEEGARLNAYELKEISDTGVTVVGPTGTVVMTPLFDPARPAVQKRPLPVTATPTQTPKK
jgi:hypothetical protein